MKTDALKKFRRKLASGQSVHGLWVTLESPSITEMAVGLGLDWVVVDAEHGHLDWKEILEHIRAAVRSDTVVFVRVAELNIALIKRALDLGADGIVIPWIETAAQLEQAMSFSKYPPEGSRGIGGERATCWGQALAQHTAEANDNVLVIPLIETVTAGRNIDQLLRVNGSELFFFGPADYSSTAGYRGQWEGPGVAEELLRLKDAIRAAGKHCGVIATSNDNLRERAAQGFQMLGIASDASLILRGLHDSLAAVGCDTKLMTNLTPPPPGTIHNPLPLPPAAMRPIHPEVMNETGSGKMITIDEGVVFECLVGAQNLAKNLTTGLVTFAPGAQLACHTHTFSESVTLLSGEATMEVEGRTYELSALDNVVIPPGVAHAVSNVSKTEPALFHVALATSAPGRTLVEKEFTKKKMSPGSHDSPTPERFNHFATAPRFEAGPNTEFIDFFNKDLIPGIEMSGGYGLFQPGGRLPAHIHDFDESISIIEGDATCVVEGRTYEMQNSTALQPRGRVHYFINNSKAPMAMLWVYAGPTPERIVVDERCATAEGNPWK